MANFVVIGCGTRGCVLADTVVEVLKEGKLPKNVEFVFLDSDDSNGGPLGKCKNIHENQVHWKHLGRNPAIDGIDWLPEEVKRTPGAGAGRIRMFGKALYYIHKDELISDINQYMLTLDDRNPGVKDRVFIILNTLSGGTGSSFFIDLAVDIRNMVVQTHRGTPPIIFGIGVLPIEKEAYQEKANALASMKELHFILSKGSDSFLNPFTGYFIVGRQNIGVPVEELPECIATFVADVILPRDPAVEQDLSNLIAKLLDPCKRRFSTLGYNEVRFPADMLSCYYDLEDKIPGIEGELRISKDNVESYKRDLHGKRDRLNRLNKDISNSEGEISEFEKKRRRISGRHRRILENARNNIEDISNRAVNLSNDINSLMEKLNELERNVDNFEDRIKSLGVMKQHIKDKLNNPQPAVATKIQTLALNDNEIETLRRMMPGIRTESMYSLISQLDQSRLSEYEQKTVVRVENATLVFDPLLNNYRFFTSQNLDEAVLNYMLQYNFLRKDATGKIVNDEEKLGGLFICISTDNANLGGRSPNIGTPPIAKPGTVNESIVDNPRRLHSFAAYLLEAGLQPWAPSQDQPPRLTELEWLTTGYNEGTQELLKRHSLFYDNPTTFSNLTQIRLPAHPADRCNKIAEFWQEYEIIDDDAKVCRTAVSIANAMSLVDKFSKGIKEINIAPVRSPGKITTVALNMLISDFTDSRMKMDNQLPELTRIREDVNSVNTAFENCISQLSSVQTAIDKQRVNNLTNMINDCQTKLDSIITSIQGKIVDFDEFFEGLEGIKTCLTEEDISDKRIETLAMSAIRNIDNMKGVAEKLKDEIEKFISTDVDPGPLMHIADRVNELRVSVQRIKPTS